MIKFIKKWKVICLKERSKSLETAIKKNELAILDDGLQEKTIYHDILLLASQFKNRKQPSFTSRTVKRNAI